MNKLTRISANCNDQRVKVNSQLNSEPKEEIFAQIPNSEVTDNDQIRENNNNERFKNTDDLVEELKQLKLDPEGGVSAQIQNAEVTENDQISDKNNDERLKSTDDLVEELKQFALELEGDTARARESSTESAPSLPTTEIPQSAQAKKSFWSRVVAKFGQTDTSFQKAAVVAMIFFSSITLLPMLIVLFATLYSDDAFHREEEELNASLSSPQTQEQVASGQPTEGEILAGHGLEIRIEKEKRTRSWLISNFDELVEDSRYCHIDFLPHLAVLLHRGICKSVPKFSPDQIKLVARMPKIEKIHQIAERDRLTQDETLEAYRFLVESPLNVESFIYFCGTDKNEMLKQLKTLLSFISLGSLNYIEHALIEKFKPVRHEKIASIFSLRKMFHFLLRQKDGLHAMIEIVHSVVSSAYIRMRGGENFNYRAIDTLSFFRDQLNSTHFDLRARLAIYDFVQSKIENFHDFLFLDGNDAKSMDRNFQKFLWACYFVDLRDLTEALGKKVGEIANDIERRHKTFEDQAKVLFSPTKKKQQAGSIKGTLKSLKPGNVKKRSETNRKNYKVLVGLYIEQQRLKGKGKSRGGLYHVCEKLAEVVERAAVENKKQIREFMELHNEDNINRGGDSLSYIESFAVNFVWPMTIESDQMMKYTILEHMNLVKSLRKEMRTRIIYFLLKGSMMGKTSKKIALAEVNVDLDLIEDRFRTLLTGLEKSNVRPLHSVLRQIEGNLAGRIKIKSKERKPSASPLSRWRRRRRRR